MSLYAVNLSRSAEKELAALSRQMQLRIAAALDAMQTDPRGGDCKRLTGIDAWRRRVGVYRIVFTVNERARVAEISVIRHRRDAYR